MFFWKSFFDGSGKHSDLLVVAGYLANKDRWKAFNKAWRPVLTTNGEFAPFHAADFESGNEDFTTEKGWPKERRDKARVQLVDALLGANLHFGIACCVKIRDYEETTPRWKKDLPGIGSAYEFAVSACMGEAAKWCHYNNQPDPIQYVVEYGEGKEGKLQDAFRNVFAQPQKRQFFRLGRLIFDSKDGAFGLQAADMLANYIWNERTGNRPNIEPYSRITHAPNVFSDYFDKARLERETELDLAGRSENTPEGPVGYKIPDPIDIEVRADFSEAEKVVSELETLAEVFPQDVYSLIKRSADVEKLFTIKTENIAAAGAHELRLAFKPSNSALDALAAIRTSNADGDLGEGPVSHND